jgi:hypothetical protein
VGTAELRKAGREHGIDCNLQEGFILKSGTALSWSYERRPTGALGHALWISCARPFMVVARQARDTPLMLRYNQGAISGAKSMTADGGLHRETLLELTDEQARC